MEIITHQEYNQNAIKIKSELIKPIATENDIIMKHNNSFYICQDVGNGNNIGCFSLENNIETIKFFYNFLLFIYYKHNIDCAQINGERYKNILSRFKTYRENDTFYFKISENEGLIQNEYKKRFQKN